MKQFILIYIVIFILVYLKYGEGDLFADLFVCGMSTLIFSVIVYIIYAGVKEAIDEEKTMTPEELNQQKKQLEIEKNKRKEKRALSKTIVQTIIIEEQVKTKVRWLDTLGRASIGHSLFGDTGAIIGAMTSKPSIQMDKVKFLIIYADDHEKVEKVKYDSKRYRELIQYL